MKWLFGVVNVRVPRLVPLGVGVVLVIVILSFLLDSKSGTRLTVNSEYVKMATLFRKAIGGQTGGSVEWAWLYTDWRGRPKMVQVGFGPAIHGDIVTVKAVVGAGREELLYGGRWTWEHYYPNRNYLVTVTYSCVGDWWTTKTDP